MEELLATEVSEASIYGSIDGVMAASVDLAISVAGSWEDFDVQNALFIDRVSLACVSCACTPSRNAIDALFEVMWRRDNG